MAFRAGTGFQALANTFFSRMPDTQPQRNQFILENLGEFVAAVTNLAFAVELFLKAALLVNGHVMQRGTHDLECLHDKLPPQRQQELEKTFQALLNRQKPINREAYELGITVAPSPPSNGPERKRPTTLRETLTAEKDAFPEWRYIFQHDVRSGQALFQSEFQLLAIAAHTLRLHLKMERR